MSTLAIRVEHLSKKFARSLKKAMLYGLKDIARAAMMPRAFQSPHFDARVGDATRESGVPPVPNSDPSLRSGEFWALHDVNFDLHRGECLGVIGHNGAGKTTMFSILSGICGLTAGRVEIHGKLQCLLALGAGFHPVLTGRENIYLNASVFGLKQREIEALYDRIVDFSELGEFMDAPIKTYSSGMLVRLGFSVAAHLNPETLLIDEVLAVGDGSFQQKCQDYSARMVNSGKAIVIVAHNMVVIQSMCSRVMWMDRGRIIMLGPTEQVVRKYKEFTIARWATTAASGRPGEGGSPAVIDSVIWTDSGGHLLDALPAGESVTATIHIVARQDIACARLWVQITDGQDRPAMGISMYEDGFTVKLSQGSNTIRLTIRALPLAPQKAYRLYVGIRDWACQAMYADSYATGLIRVTGARMHCENGMGGAMELFGITDSMVAPVYRWDAEQGAKLCNESITN